MATEQAVDLSEFEELSARKGPQCVTCQAIASLPDDERAKAQAAMAAPHITAAAISRWLKQHGHQIAQNSVQRHRRGECKGA